MDKHHCISFSSRVNNLSSSAFELVHSDVCGPCRVPSFKGFRYFLIFVDDISRMTLLYLLKERSEVSNVIELFFNEIKNQFSTSIHVLRTDNVLEYVKIMCSFSVLRIGSFTKPLVITRHNRMRLLNENIHILDLARILVIHMHVPKYLWSDAVLSACHLIN